MEKLSNMKKGGVEVVLEGPSHMLIEQAFHFTYKVSNNQAEYEAFITGVILDRDMGIRIITCKSDS